MAQGSLVFGRQGHHLAGWGEGMAGLGQEATTEAFVQRQQAGFGGGLGPDQPVPVAGLQHHRHRLPQTRLQHFQLRDH
jgi:hypothetical protein